MSFFPFFFSSFFEFLRVEFLRDLDSKGTSLLVLSVNLSPFFSHNSCDPAIVISTMCGYQERKAGVRKVKKLFSFFTTRLREKERGETLRAVLLQLNPHPLSFLPFSNSHLFPGHPLPPRRGGLLRRHRRHRPLHSLHRPRRPELEFVLSRRRHLFLESLVDRRGPAAARLRARVGSRRRRGLLCEQAVRPGDPEDRGGAPVRAGAGALFSFFIESERARDSAGGVGERENTKTHSSFFSRFPSRQMYFMVSFKFAGAGVLSAIVLGVAVAQAWGRGLPSFLSSGPNETFATQVEHQVSAAWTWVAQPLLFGLVGTQVVFSKIPREAVPRALAAIFAGWAARMPATFLSVSFSHLNTREKLFVVLNWLPKATVQAALAAAPLERVEAEMGAPEAGAAAAEYTKFGEDALVTILLSVLICGPLGVALVALLGPMLVKPDGEEEEGGAGKGKLEAADAGGSSSSVGGGRRAGGGHLRRLGSDAASALAAMPAASVGGRAWQLLSMPTVLPAVTRTGGGVVGVGGGGAGGARGAPKVGGAAAAGEKEETENEEVQELDEDEELERLRREDVDDAYADALLADVDPCLHALLQEVELEAWQLEAAAGSAPVGRAAAAAAAARLRGASAGLRRRLLEREPGRIASVDGAREFFRRLQATEGRGAGGGGAGRESNGTV